MILYPIPGIYKNDDIFDISIIVPMYKSKKVVADQIARWPATDKELKIEIIYVDDACPQHSSQAVMKGWNKRRDKFDFVVKLIVNRNNVGFGSACNTGAFHAKGKYLIFLNADAVPNPNWIYPIFNLFQTDSSIGIIGNLQLKEGGEFHGTVDGAGSEWYWPETQFIHIGRHILNGKKLNRPLNPDELPKEILCVGERDMVTGCCLAIPKTLFDHFGGFNNSYRIGYWEDSELCMTIKEAGYKIMFQPESIVWHKLSDSKISKHDYQEANKLHFMNKWDSPIRFDKLIKTPRPIAKKEPRVILVKREAANGDVLLATGVAAALHKKYPEAFIHFCTNCPDVISGNPYCRFIDYISAFNNLHRYHLVVDLNNVYERRPKIHILQAYADEANVKVEDMKFFIHEKKIYYYEIPNDYVVLHAGRTDWMGRNWHDAKFNELAQKLLDRGENVILIGHGSDRKTPCSFDLRDKISLHELVYVIKRAKLHVGIDSFPMHIAQAVNTPGVCFFGCVNPNLRIFRNNMIGVQAENLPCVGCHHEQMPSAVCLKKCKTKNLDCENFVTTQMMWNKIEEKLCSQNL